MFAKLSKLTLSCIRLETGKSRRKSQHCLLLLCHILTSLDKAMAMSKGSAYNKSVNALLGHAEYIRDLPNLM